MSKCLTCGAAFEGDKRAISCLPCAVGKLQDARPTPTVEGGEDAPGVLDTVTHDEVLKALQESRSNWKSYGERVAAERDRLSAALGEAERALEPFAAVDGPVKAEQGRPNLLGLMTLDGEYDELILRSYTNASRWEATLSAQDFRDARAALSTTKTAREG